MILLLILASIIYHPEPTAEALWTQYFQLGEEYAMLVSNRADYVATLGIDPSACIEAYNVEVAKPSGLKEMYGLQLMAIAEYYELYADDEAVDRFNDKAVEIRSATKEVMKTFDKCIEQEVAGQKEVKNDGKIQS